MKKTKASGKVVKNLIPRAGSALKNEFYLETSWIISSILEMRLKNIISRVEGKSTGTGYNLDRSLKRVKYLILRGDQPALTEEIGVGLIDAIRTWKNKRNKLLKEMCDQHISKLRFAGLAEEGIVLMQEMNESHKKFKKAWTRSVAPPSEPPEIKTEEHEPV
ncbi:MAG: hypothetical protein NTW10_06965 [Bacteroidetes bacterium]|nr:hypothetical protein [Bacteroidota bacterium]